MTISHWLTNSAKTRTEEFDALILGGGIAGLSTAYWLQKKDPKLKIALIEKDRIGFGASGRNAGFVTCGSVEHFINLEEKFGFEKGLEIWNFSQTNHDLLRQYVIEDAGNDLDYRQSGSCTIAPSEERWAQYQAVAKRLREAGVDMREVAPPVLESDYGIAGFHGGILYGGDGYIHPIKLLTRLRGKLSAKVFEGHEVYSIENESGGGGLVRTDQGSFRAPRIFLTMNAYLPLVMDQFEKVIRPGRAQALLTEPLPPFVKGPCYLTKHLCYFRQLPTGHLLVGGFRNLALESENTYADQITPKIQNAIDDFIRQHFKLGTSVRIAHRWSGLLGFSPDGQMLVGGLPGQPSVSVMAGCCGHGMGLSFHAAKCLVENAYGKDVPSHLRIERFAL